MKPINILHIEDDEDDVILVKLILIEAGISFTQKSEAASFFSNPYRRKFSFIRFSEL